MAPPFDRSFPQLFRGIVVRAPLGFQMSMLLISQSRDISAVLYSTTHSHSFPTSTSPTRIHQPAVQSLVAVTWSQYTYTTLPNMINAFLVFNGQGQPRLTKFYTQLVNPPHLPSAACWLWLRTSMTNASPPRTQVSNNASYPRSSPSSRIAPPGPATSSLFRPSSPPRAPPTPPLSNTTTCPRW